ncbi:RidA family protein [Novosphingobium sp. KCTC 2891]|uniref:RidA family protein n=1 Tax=Novosphingobium sp. KCTC 2891 TaxID=2989730 RepID=UPI00222222D8|nr:RidA family protein [Novosphingobium sp. KCTC 2891]MCW1383568.1 RidA family protein [Novosphingobium sp. KCTC 2891]
MKRSAFLPFVLLAGLATPAAAAGTIVRHPAPAANAPILSGVTVPAGAETLYLSGQVPPVVDAAADPASPAAYGDTRTQSIGVFRKIEALLKEQGYSLSDVVKLTVFLAGDPAKGGKLDFAGFSEAYGQFFGTATQPNKVARSTVQVAALVSPGFLVEIEATAARAK